MQNWIMTITGPEASSSEYLGISQLAIEFIEKLQAAGHKVTLAKVTHGPDAKRRAVDVLAANESSPEAPAPELAPAPEPAPSKKKKGA